MILSKELYDKCCPSYQKVIDELEKKIAEIEKCDDAPKGIKVISAVCQFSKRYLTPGEYWQHCIKLLGRFDFDCRDIVKHIVYYHLYMNKYWSERFIWGSNYPKLDDFRYSSDWEGNTIYEHDLDYPHDCLEFCLREYEQQKNKTSVKRSL
jgi:hypothetical protein